MKINYLLIIATVASLSSCSTAYRSGQTPDDVYYSPAPVSVGGTQDNSYLSTLNNKDQNSYSYRNSDESNSSGNNNSYYTSPISLGLGMGYGYSPFSMYGYNSFMNPYSSLMNPYSYGGYGYNSYGLKGMYDPYYNDLGFSSPYGFGYSPYSFGYSPYSFGYSPYGGLGLSPYSYGGYYSPIVFSTKAANTNVGPRRYNLNVYNNERIGTNRNDQPIRNTQTGTVDPSRGSGVGRVLRRVFSPQENNTYVRPNNNNNDRTYNNNNSNQNNSNNQTPQRSFSSPSVSSPSSSSPSSNSSSAPVRTFRR
ncbi:MAG: hypothetical protein ABI359_05395 [Ginsengibacter sp.]